MNRTEFKKAMSGVRSSEQTLERILDMTNNGTKKRVKFAPALAVAACLALLVTGIWGGSAYNSKRNPVANALNVFAVSAYAKDENDSQKKIDLSENKVAKTDLKLELTKGEKTGVYDTVVCHSETGFIVEGENIKSATYCAERGSFSYQSLYGNDFDDPKTESRFISDNPYSTRITFDKIGDKECMEVFYNPNEAVDLLLRSKDADFDYSTLPSDVITISVEFNDGSRTEKSIKTSFDKDGYMLLEYVK